MEAANPSHEDYTSRLKAVDVALDSCGIGHLVRCDFMAGTKRIAQAAHTFIQEANEQLAHDLLVNTPTRTPYGNTPEERHLHATLRGLIATINTLLPTSDDALHLAGEILEDFNEHETAAVLFKMAEDRKKDHI